MNQPSRFPIRHFLERTAVGRVVAKAITAVLVFQMLVLNHAQVLAADPPPAAVPLPPIAGQVANALVTTGSVVNIGATVQLDGSRSFDADGNPLAFRWALTSRPAGSAATLSNPAIADPTFVADRVGTYVAQLIVDDGKEWSAPDTVAVLAVPTQITVPNVVGLAEQDARAAIIAAKFTVGSVTTAAHATIPAGNVISQAPVAGSTASEGSPVNLVVSSGPTTVTVPNVIGLAQADARTAITNAGLTVGTETAVNNTTFPAGQVFSQSPGAGSSVPGPSPVHITVSAGPGNTTVPNLAGLTQTQADSALFPAQLLLGNVTLNSHPTVPAGQITSQNPAAGATATPGDSVDAVLSTGPFAPGGTAPVVTIHSPAANSTVTYLADVVATVTDANLALYQVQFAPASAVDANNPAQDDPDYVLISQGTTPVTNAVVGTFDPTLLENDSYVIRVKAIDSGGLVTARTTTVGVSANAKLGQFSLEFTDLTVPLVGIPIEIVRRYDSANAGRSGDFGYGWSLGMRDADVRALLKPSFAGPTLAPASRLYLTAPDGRRIGFTAQHRILSIFIGTLVEVSYAPDPGVYEKVDILDGNQCYLSGGVYLGGILGSERYVPRKYRLIQKDGTKYDYDTTAGLEKITDLIGNTVTFTPNAITHSSGQSIPLVRDAANRITRITDPEGKFVTYDYSAQGDLIAFTDRTDLQTRFTYRAVPKHYLDAVIDPLGRMAARTEYDEHGRVVAIIDALGNRQEQTFDPSGFTGTRTDARGNVITLAYNPRGNLLEERDPAGGITRYEYNDPANPDRETATIDPLGRRTVLAYDPRGNVLSFTDPNGNTSSLTYDASNRTTSASNGLGQAVQFTYDAAGNVTEVTDNAGNKRRTIRDAQGRALSVIDAVGNVTHFDYTNGCACGAPGKVINPDGSFRLFEYDAAGNVTKETDETGIYTLYTYDREGRLLSSEDAQGHRTTYSYRGELRELVTDPLGNSTRTDYDDNNRPIRITDAEGGVLGFEYDAAGNRTKVTDAAGDATSFTYDEIGRITEEMDTLGHKRFHFYDASGNRTEFVDRNGRRRTFEFDGVDRVTKEQWWIGGSIIRTLEFGYNAVHRTRASDPVARHDFVFDALNRLSTHKAAIVGLPEVTLAYTYNKNGQVTSVSDNLGVSVATDYDAQDRIARRLWQGIGIDPARLDYGYDPAGRHSSLDRFTDLAGLQPAGRTTKGYNALGLLDTVTHRSPANEVQASYDYEFNAAGQMTRWVIDGQDSRYTYDRTGQVLTADFASQQDETYAYDKNGNRSSAGYAIGGDNHLTSDGVRNYGYDNEGNLVSRTNPETGESDNYEYDHRNRLTKVVRRNGQTVILTADYAFDALNHRVSESINGTATYFVHDGEQAWLDFDQGGTVANRYLLGGGFDEMLGRHRGSDGAWYLADHLGSIRGICTRAGELQGVASFGAFGQERGNTIPASFDRFAFTGREYSTATGLYHYRARSYASDIGRFLSPDPMGFDAGDYNLYRYVGNAPTFATDPLGETVFSEYAIKASISTAKAAIIRCLGSAAWTTVGEVGIYILLSNAGFLGGANNVYVGKTAQTFEIRFSQHASSGIGGRGLDIIKKFPIPLNPNLSPKDLRTAEQLVINAFGGKARLLNVRNASRILLCK